MITGICLIIAGLLIALYPPLLSIIVAALLISVGIVLAVISYRLKKMNKHFSDPFANFFMRFQAKRRKAYGTVKEYDFGLNWSVKSRECFINSLKNACQKRGLSFLWICNDNVRDVIKKLENGELKIKFLLDTEATYNKDKDPYVSSVTRLKIQAGQQLTIRTGRALLQINP